MFYFNEKSAKRIVQGIKKIESLGKGIHSHRKPAGFDLCFLLLGVTDESIASEDYGDVSIYSTEFEDIEDTLEVWNYSDYSVEADTKVIIAVIADKYFIISVDCPPPEEE